MEKYACTGSSISMYTVAAECFGCIENVEEESLEGEEALPKRAASRPWKHFGVVLLHKSEANLNFGVVLLHKPEEI